jgi:hypothetical protein
MAIAADERLSNSEHVPNLPPRWETLYELTKLDDEQLDARLTAATTASPRRAFARARKTPPAGNRPPRPDRAKAGALATAVLEGVRPR